jgi:hypothetical protein
MKEKESQIEAFLVSEVKKISGLAIKMTSPALRGLPDRAVLLPSGIIAFVELKATGEVPRPQQQKRIAELRALGFMVWVIDSKVDVMKFIGAMKALMEI